MASAHTGLSFSGKALVFLCLWDMLERNLAAAYAWRCQPFEIPEEPAYFPADVSVVLITTRPAGTLTKCLRLWLENQPKEVIIVTTPRNLESVKRLVTQLGQDDDKITILATTHDNHREQQTRGIEAATGKIIFLADDGAFCSTPDVIRSLLAPFEEPRVGAVGGKSSVDISPDHHPAVSTPWEAISRYSFDRFNSTSAAHFGADRSVWVLNGGVKAIRAGILHDPAFQHEFNHETWRGMLVRTGSSGFVTRWIKSHGWKIAFQDADEADVLTTPRRDGAVVRQLVQRLRNSHMFLVSGLLWAPGFSKMARKHPYMARKMLERVFHPVLALAHLAVWVGALLAHPKLWLMITAWYAFLYCRTYRGFADKYPWLMSHVWALFLMDTVGGLLLEAYAWFTLNHEMGGLK